MNIEFYIGTKSNFGKPWDFEIGWWERRGASKIF